jgi:hypothetical protein
LGSQWGPFEAEQWRALAGRQVAGRGLVLLLGVPSLARLLALGLFPPRPGLCNPLLGPAQELGLGQLVPGPPPAQDRVEVEAGQVVEAVAALARTGHPYLSCLLPPSLAQLHHLHLLPLL